MCVHALIELSIFEDLLLYSVKKKSITVNILKQNQLSSYNTVNRMIKLPFHHQSFTCLCVRQNQGMHQANYMFFVSKLHSSSNTKAALHTQTHLR